MRTTVSVEKNFPLSLNGEIDKRGHIGFEQGDRKNPDFVFHIPGQFEGNTVVVEVKGKLKGNQEKIRKDFRTLITFIQKYQYRLGIFILYNYTKAEFKRKMKVFPEAEPDTLGKIRILCIKEAKAAAEESTLAEFLR